MPISSVARRYEGGMEDYSILSAGVEVYNLVQHDVEAVQHPFDAFPSQDPKSVGGWCE